MDDDDPSVRPDVDPNKPFSSIQRTPLELIYPPRNENLLVRLSSAPLA
jgi:hypothetical protein